MEDKDKFELKPNRLFNKFSGYVYYILIGIISFILLNLNQNVEIILGDSGKIVEILLLLVSITSIKWLPLLCILGVILQYNKEKAGDITNTYMLIVGIVFSTSLFLLLITQ